MKNSKISILLIAIIIGVGTSLYYNSESTSGESSEVYVLHAGTLTKPFKKSII